MKKPCKQDSNFDAAYEREMERETRLEELLADQERSAIAAFRKSAKLVLVLSRGKQQRVVQALWELVRP